MIHPYFLTAHMQLKSQLLSVSITAKIKHYRIQYLLSTICTKMFKIENYHQRQRILSKRCNIIGFRFHENYDKVIVSRR